ncbi:MAG TPA: fatty acid desaturase [Bryobacteraceae bacterium]|nr:fatty acid desaturase [Bryobacteraceae bacterium]
MSGLWMFLITLGILQVSVFLTTIYLHRAMCHRGLDLHPVVANLMHLELSLFTGIVPREWVAVHRKHHHFSDREGDPHSPYLLGLWQVLFGNYFLYRKEIRNGTTIRKYTPDYRPDLIDRIPLIRFGVVGGLAIFIVMFGWAWGLAAWSFHVVGYILLNSSINSLCHMLGYRNYDNLATNIRLIAWMTGGEGLHNNHHEYPSSAKFALKRKEFDPAWPVICLLERFGLARVKPEPLAKAA